MSLGFVPESSSRALDVRVSLLSLAAVGLFSLGGCATLRPTPPDGFDLSGVWTLNPVSDVAPGEARRSAPTVIMPGAGGAPRPAPGGALHGDRGPGLFAVRPDLAVMRADKLTICQSADSMGIWVPGEPLRDVSWGKVERGALEIEAGWDDAGVLVVRSRADGGSLTERYLLSSDRMGLILKVAFEPKRGRAIKLVRYFDRSAADPGAVKDPPHTDFAWPAGEPPKLDT